VLGASPLWNVADTRADRLVAELDFGAHPELLATFPFPHRLELAIELAPERLSVRLEVIPTGSEAVPISFGFHPYLRCDRHDAEIELPVRRRALLDERGLPTGEHEEVGPGALNGPLGERTFDDCFDELAADPVFSVSDAQRTISIEFVGGAAGRAWPVAQVYAPEGSDFICFEPMTAPVDALRSGQGLRWVPAGSRFAAEFAISIRSR
jgi:galactose mutarotase-like enzyme